jgi:TatD DNase family protein
MHLPELTDSHCHLDLTAAALGSAIPELLAACRQNGVNHLVQISTGMESYLTMAPYLDTEGGLLSLALGIMPGEPPASLDDKVIQIMEKKQICAIGEIGLDYYRHPETREVQKELFARQCALARDLALPIVIHNRDADADLLEVLTRFRGLSGVLHCFTGGPEMAAAVLALGYHVSFSGIVTFRSAQQIQAAARTIPAERLLVETDCPYLSPVPLRGEVNRPWHVAHTVAFLAALRAETPEAVAAGTAANARRLFGLPG